MERAIQIFAAVNFMVIGLSHIFQHRAWAEFFVWLHAQGRPGALANGFLSLLTGSLIVAFHNVWTGPETLLTCVGWSLLLKSAVVFLAPNLGLHSIGKVRPEISRRFIIPGVLLVTLAAVLIYILANDQ